MLDAGLDQHPIGSRRVAGYGGPDAIAQGPGRSRPLWFPCDIERRLRGELAHVINDRRGLGEELAEEVDASGIEIAHIKSPDVLPPDPSTRSGPRPRMSPALPARNPSIWDQREPFLRPTPHASKGSWSLLARIAKETTKVAIVSFGVKQKTCDELKTGLRLAMESEDSTGFSADQDHEAGRSGWLRSSRRSSRLTGLTRWTLKPASRERRRSSSLPYPVMATSMIFSRSLSSRQRRATS